MGDLAERVREQMLETLTEISAQRSTATSPNGGAQTQIHDLPGSEADRDLRKRSGAAEPSISQNVSSSSRPTAPSAGGENATEDEMDEDGAILVARPQAKATA